MSILRVGGLPIIWFPFLFQVAAVVPTVTIYGGE